MTRRIVVIATARRPRCEVLWFVRPRPRRCACGAAAFETLEQCSDCIASSVVAAFVDGFLS
jgi:hypothetical protein